MIAAARLVGAHWLAEADALAMLRDDARLGDAEAMALPERVPHVFAVDPAGKRVRVFRRDRCRMFLQEALTEKVRVAEEALAQRIAELEANIAAITAERDAALAQRDAANAERNSKARQSATPKAARSFHAGPIPLGALTFACGSSIAVR